MARLSITDGSSVEYSLSDGHIRECVLRHEILYDEGAPLVRIDWQERCWRWVIAHHGFSMYDRPGRWLRPMFVDWLDRQLHDEIAVSDRTSGRHAPSDPQAD